MALQLDRLELADADVDFSDARSGAHWQAHRLALRLGLQYDGAAPRLRLDDVALAMQLGAPLPTQLPLSLQLPTLTLAGRSLALPQWTLQLANTTTRGRAEVGLQPLSARGHVELRCDSVRVLLSALGQAWPPTRDRGVLGAATVAADFSYAGDVRLDSVNAGIDGVTFVGEASVDTTPRVSVTLRLEGGDVDLDRYLSPADYHSPPFELPVALLKSLPLAGSIHFKSTRLRGVTMHGVRLRLGEGEQ